MATERRDEGPYVGPRPFEPEHSHLFFGRARETSEALSLVVAHPVLVLYAPSGAGKTSLLNAGLIPELKEEGFDVLPTARVQGRIPAVIRPEEVENPYALNAMIDWSPEGADARQMLSLRLVDFLAGRERPADEFGFEAPRVLIFDQFEELLTAYAERWVDRTAFVEQVSEALAKDPLLRVVFSIREDRVAELEPYAPLLPEKLRTRLRLERLRSAAAVQAVKGPLSGTGRSFAEGVAEKLVRDLMEVQVVTAQHQTEVVTGEFVEPVQLQVVCKRLWENVPANATKITQEHCHEFGDVNQALQEFYEAAIEAAVNTAAAPRTDIRDLRARANAWIAFFTIRRAVRNFFDRHLITPLDTRSTIFEGQENTGGLPNQVVDTLQSEHIVRAENRAGARWYELTHDRFIRPIRQSNQEWRTGRYIRLALIGLAAAFLAVSSLLIAWAISPPHTCAGETRRGDRLMRDGLYSEAVKKYNDTIEKFPDCAPAYHGLALAHDNPQQRAQALLDYVEAGKAYITLAQYRRARDDLNRAIELDDAHAPVYALRALVFLDMGDYEQAGDNCTKAIALDPGNAPAHSYLGLSYCYQAEQERASQEYEEAWQAYTETGSFQQAAEDLALAAGQTPPLACSSAWLFLCRVRSREAKYEDAIDACTKAIELDQDLAAAYFVRGFAHAGREDLKSAMADYTQALELEPGYALARFHRGKAYAKLDDSEQAIADFDAALQITPDHVPSHLERAKAYEAQGDLERAVDDYSAAIELEPLNAQFYLGRGLLHYEIGSREQEAIADFLQVIELKPDSVEAYLRLGALYYGLAQAVSPEGRLANPDLDLAILSLQRAVVVAPRSDAVEVRLQTHPQLANSLYLKGEAYVWAQDPSTAEQLFDLAIAESRFGLDLTVETEHEQLAPAYLILAAAYHQKAHMYFQTGPLAESNRLYQSALQAYDACTTHAGQADLEEIENTCTDLSTAVQTALAALGSGGGQ